MHELLANILFEDPYFYFNVAQRTTIKVVASSIYAVFIGITAILLSSGTGQLQWLGALFLLILLDRLAQIYYGEHKIAGDVVRKISQGVPMNAAPYLRQDSRKFLDKALTAVEIGKANLEIALFSELIGLAEVKKGLQRLDIDINNFSQIISQKLNQAAETASNYRDLIPQIAISAFQESLHFGESSISPAALFLGLLQLKTDALAGIFREFNFEESDFHNAIIFGRLADGAGRKFAKGFFGSTSRKKVPHRIMNRAWTARWTPLLDSVSRDLTDLAHASQIGLLIGHNAEFRTLLNILGREDKNNALLIGAPGIGKNTLVEHLASAMIRDEVPEKLFDKRLLEVHIAEVTSGAKTIGEIQERFGKLVREALDTGNIVLYFPDIHNLKLTSEEGSINAFEFLKPIFQASSIPTIGATTPQDFQKTIEPETDFAALFESIRVEEVSEDEAAELLTYQSFMLEAKWGVTISYRAIRRAVKLAHRYLRQKPLPSSAIDLLNEALSDAKNQKKDSLSEEDLANVFTAKTKIPSAKVAEGETKKLLDLETEIHKSMVDQEEAVKAVASAIRQYRAGLSREKGTIATFLFVGPTGVGKTELSKTLAAAYFGSENEMVRFDMSEYKDEHAIWNFIGSPDGKIRGNLTEAIRTKPFSLILLDEFEKAHNSILELFLPLFDEGRLADSAGNVVDFSNTIIICTSNAHSDLIKSEIEKGVAVPEIAAEIKKRLTEYFKPELINRFDDIIVFKPLSQADIEQIARLQMNQLVRKLNQEQGIAIDVPDEVIKLLAKLGWDPVFGARPLRGVIRDKINEMLATKILQKEINRGDKINLKVYDSPSQISQNETWEGKEIIMEKMSPA